MGQALKAIAVKPAYELIYKTKKANEAFCVWRYFNSVQQDDWNKEDLENFVAIARYAFYHSRA